MDPKHPEVPTELVERFLKTLGMTQDLTLTVLRAHLLIEEQLWKVLRASVRRADYLDSARLSFRQLAALVMASTGADQADPLWRFLGDLNKLRNALAHSLDAPELDAKVRALTDMMRSELSVTEERPSSWYLFTMAVGRIAGGLEAEAYMAESRTKE